MKIEFIFAWYDLWVGLFYDKKKHWLYFLFFPTVGIIFKLPSRRWFLFNNDGSVWDTTQTPDIWVCKKKMYWAINGGTKPIFKKDMAYYNDYLDGDFTKKQL